MYILSHIKGLSECVYYIILYIHTPSRKMPCACKVPVPDYPSNAEWGPILWTILHGLAEKAQRASLPPDEVREWQRFLKATGEMLPCDVCQAHYVRYSKENPITHFSEIPYSLLKNSIKTWLWQLHSDIRTEYGKEVLPFDQLGTVYGSVNLQDQLWRLEPIIKTTINIKGYGLMKWTNWVKTFKMLRATLGA